jgi:hypothetical protein
MIMDISKSFGGVRYSLNQDNDNQITIKKEKEIISVQNLDHKLEEKEAFKILKDASSGKYFVTELKGNEEKLNTEKKIIVPKPNPCLFCGGIPEVIDIKSTENSGAAMRALQCTGLKCAASIVKSEKTGERRITYKRWIYSVDVVDSVEKADAKLITEWNRRMPLKGAK